MVAHLKNLRVNKGTARFYGVNVHFLLFRISQIHGHNFTNESKGRYLNDIAVARIRSSFNSRKQERHGGVRNLT